MNTEQLINVFREANTLPAPLPWSLLMKLLTPNESSWPVAAARDEIITAGHRLKVKFSAAQVEIYRLHNGLPSLNILPLAEILLATQQSITIDQFDTQQPPWYRINTMGTAEPATLDKSQITGCLISGGYHFGKTADLIPSILWCPNSNQQTIIDVQSRHFFPDFRTYIQSTIANILAAEQVI